MYRKNGYTNFTEWAVGYDSGNALFSTNQNDIWTERSYSKWL